MIAEIERDAAATDRIAGRPPAVVGGLGGIEWLRENGVDVIEMNSSECTEMLSTFISQNPELWNEDIGIPPEA